MAGKRRLPGHAAYTIFDARKCSCGCETYKLTLFDDDGRVIGHCGYSAQGWIEMIRKIMEAILRDADRIPF
jgi:hypothetical protein